MCCCMCGCEHRRRCIRLEPEWTRVYESRQCARREQGSEKDVAAVGGWRQHQAEGPPSRRQFD